MRRALRNDRGNVSVIVASAAMMILAIAALVVDLGFIFLKTRQMQGVADLAAMAAARDMPRARQAAEATAAANGWDGPVEVQVTTGAYRPDAARSASRRFRAGAGPADAVRVTASGEVDLFFGAVLLGRPKTRVTRTATAAQVRLASFSVGTRLASVDGGAANALLSALTGSRVSLSVMDYNALAGADIDLLRYATALSTHLEAQGLSYDDVLASDVSTGQALTAFAQVLDDDGETAAAKAARALAAAAGARPARLDRLLDLGPYGAQDYVSADGAGVQVGALDFANALLLLAGEGRQVKVELGAAVPGLADVDLWLAIGERPNNSPWLTVAADGSQTIRTAQARLYLDASVSPGGLGSLGVAEINLPVLVEIAAADARLSSIWCEAGAVDLDVRPGVGSLSIGAIDRDRLSDFRREMKVGPARLVSAPLVSVTGQAEVGLGGERWQTVRFSRADIAGGAAKTVSTRDLTQAAVGSLIGELDLQVSVGGLGLGLGRSAVTATVGGALSAAAAPLDGLVNGLTDLLGVGLGEADVRVGGMRCNDAALVA